MMTSDEGRSPPVGAMPVRCPHCHRLFFKVIDGLAQVEIVCPRCRQMVTVTAANQSQPAPTEPIRNP